MAAGLGTRMKSDTAKVLHQIAGRPMLHWVVTAARTAGAERVVAILGHKHEAVKAVARRELRRRRGRRRAAARAARHRSRRAVRAAGGAERARRSDRRDPDRRRAAARERADRRARRARARRRRPAWRCSRRCRPRPMPYGRLVRDASGMLEKIVEHADATAGAAQDPRHQRGLLRDPARPPAQGPRDAARRQREGRAVPDRSRRARRRARRCDGDRRAVHRGRRHQRSRRPRGASRSRRAAASTRRGCAPA